MANAFYNSFSTKLATAAINLTTANIKLAIVDAADYTINLTTHDALDDIPGGAIVSTSGNLASVTFGSVAAGVFDAADLTLTGVTGDPFELGILYVDSGTASTSWLICAFDTATGLPGTPNGGDFDVTWNASGIFKIC